MKRVFVRLATAVATVATFVLAGGMPAHADYVTTINWCVSTAQNGSKLLIAQSDIADVVPDHAQFELYAYNGQTLAFDTYKTSRKITVSGPDESGIYHYRAQVTYRLHTPLTADYLYQLNVAWYAGKTVLQRLNESSAYGDALAGMACGT